MSFTTDDVLDRAKRKLGITDDSQDTLLLEAMDDCHSDIDLALSPVGMGWKAATVNINVVADTDLYVPDNLFYCVTSAHFKVGDVYTPLSYDPNILTMEYNSANPVRGVSYFAMQGNSIRLRGVPDQTVTSGLRLIVYPEQADDFSSGDEITDDLKAVRNLYVNYLCRTYEEAGDSKQPNIYSIRFDKMLEKFMLVAQNRHNSQNVLYSNMDF